MFLRRFAVVWVAVLALCLGLVGCQPRAAGGLTVSEAWVRSSPMVDRAGAAYFVISNTGRQADRLLAVRSDVAATIELHETKDVGGMMEMAPVSGIEVPAGGSVALEPGGLHVMLLDLTRTLAAGERVTLTLEFETAEDLVIGAEVRE
jgi:copper(I)-binding protein